MEKGDFAEEFGPEKIDLNKRKEKIFDLKQKPVLPQIDFTKELRAHMADKHKKSYSVYEDKLLVEAIRSAPQSQSINSVLEAVTSQLINRSFESVKERYKKWIKRFSDSDLNKILSFCKDKERVVLESYMVKRKLDERKGICQLVEIVPIEVGMKYGYKNQAVDDDDRDVEGDDEAIEVEAVEVGEANQPISILAESPKFGKVSEKSVDIGKALAMMPDSAKKLGSMISDIDYERPKFKAKDKQSVDLKHRKQTDPEDNSPLGKRHPLHSLVTSDVELNLEQKAAKFKENLKSSEGSVIANNSVILFKILRHLASYHQLRLADVVSKLDSYSDLDLGALRFQLCNKTTIDSLTRFEHFN